MRTAGHSSAPSTPQSPSWPPRRSAPWSAPWPAPGPAPSSVAEARDPDRRATGPYGTIPNLTAKSATASVCGGAAPPVSVLYVLGAFPVLSETFISNEIRAMRAQGHRVVPLALAPHEGDCQPEDAAFRDETLALADIPAWRAMMASARDIPGLISALQFANEQTGIRPRSLMLAGMRVAAVARARGCTHLHAHFALPAAATAIVAARLAGVTSSFTGHGYDIYGTPADLPLKLRSVSVAIAVCDDMRGDFETMAPEARVRKVYCGVDPDRFRPSSGGEDNGRLLAIGRLVEQKGYDVLLEALAELDPAERPRIDVVGGGEMADTLPRRAADLGVAGSIRFLGARPSGWIVAEGPAYRGFVAPYRLTANGDRDTGPIVVKEAMAMGLPVVASALMGLKDTVTPDCGRLVPPRDVPALAGALRWLNGLDPDTRRAMGRAGRRRICRHFSIAAQAEGLVDAIRSVQS